MQACEISTPPRSAVHTGPSPLEVRPPSPLRTRVHWMLGLAKPRNVCEGRPSAGHGAFTNLLIETKLTVTKEEKGGEG